MWRSWKTGWLLIVAAALCALAAGCSGVHSSCIDPSGEHVFVPPPPPANYNAANERYFDDPMGRIPSDDVAVQLRPQEIVAPVGGEVVLVAGVCGPDGYLRTNRRLEWTIAAGSVGHFVAVEKGGTVDLLLGDFNWPRKIDATYAIGSTSRSNIRLNRGACVPETNVLVRRGEGWISLTSPVEGTSNVTVVAPEVYFWNARIKSAMVHWVDALAQFPPTSISPAGTRHVFTTTVTRHLNQSPCEGWRVRYEITGGPPAGFSPDGAQVVEVPTNSAGQASVKIFQKQPAHGTNKVGIQVIRPADTPGAGGRKLVVDSGATSQTWTAPDLAIHATGPAVANVGATLNYRIAVTNPGDLPAKDVVATDAVPDGVTYVGSNPPAEAVGRQLRWQLGELGARQQRLIDVGFRAEKQGPVTNCCEATAAGGLKVSECTATTIVEAGAPLSPAAGPSTMDIRITSPAQDTVAVGSQITFQVAVTNRGPSPVVKARIKDRFDPGLEYKGAPGENLIDRRLDLAVGQTQRLAVAFRVTKPGRLCHVVEVSGTGVVTATAQACIMAVGEAAAPGAGPTNVSPPPTNLSPPPTNLSPPPTGPTPTPLSVKISGPKQLVVGETAQFVIEVTNQGAVALRNVKLVDRSDPGLEPALATEGSRVEDRSLVWIIDSLAPGETKLYKIQCACETAAAKVCSRASVVLPDGTHAEDEACLEIRPATAPPTPPARTGPTPSVAPPAPVVGLTLSVAGLSNPIRAGKELTYEIQVSNKGTASYRQVSVTATVPDGMVPNPLGTVGPNPLGTVPTAVKLDGQLVRFDPVPEVRPGDSLIYRVRVRAAEAGTKKFHVELTAAALAAPLVQEASTEVLVP